MICQFAKRGKQTASRFLHQNGNLQRVGMAIARFPLVDSNERQHE